MDKVVCWRGLTNLRGVFKRKSVAHSGAQFDAAVGHVKSLPLHAHAGMAFFKL